MTAPPAEPRTVEEILVARLREELVTGALRPGDRLAYRDLAQRFGVSVTPVRIALRELASEGLVRLRAHTGAWVSSRSVDELEEIFTTRIGIEGWLARHGAPQLGDTEIVELTGLVDRLRHAERHHDREAYVRASRDLRVTCYRVADKPRLLERFSALFDLSTRYQFLTLAEDSRLAQSRAGMEAFFAACTARDGLAAEQAIRGALSATLLHVVGVLVGAPRRDGP